MTARSRHQIRLRALFVSLGFGAGIGLLAVLIQYLPIGDRLKESILKLALCPLLAIMWILSRMIDTFGPKGRPEAASSYLPAWAGYSLIGVSVVLMVGVFFVVAFAVLSWMERRRDT